MITQTKKQFHTANLSEFAQTLKDNGFTVLVPKKYEFEWLFFFKDGNFGTVGPDSFYNYNFGTVHKPCRECGTGYGMARETDLTIKNATDCLIFAPSWAASSEIKAVMKYNTVDEFINSTHNKWAEYSIY